MAAPLEIVERRVGTVTILQVIGRLALDDGGDRILQQRVDALVAAGRTNLLLDLSRVTSIDSGGVGTLASMNIHSAQRGGQFKLLSPSARVERVLRTTHLHQTFDVFHDERAAVESFPGVTTRV